MIELIATAESVEQAVELLATGVDTLYIGEETFGLRLPVSFTRDEQREIVKRAHEIYDGETLVTSSRQINFWSKRGAIGAVLAREVPFEEMVAMEENLAVPAEILVYGATCIHQSKRPLIQNYYNYTKNDKGVTKDEGLFISEPKKPETHYSIYEDSHGTHIFANNDVNLMNELTNLYDHHYRTWKLDGLYTPGENFVAIARLFAEAKAALEAGTWSEDQAAHATAEIEKLHPTGRGLDNGFFDLSADAIK